MAAPLLLLFDPGRDVWGIVERFAPAARRTGWLAASCFQVANGTDDSVDTEAMMSLLERIRERRAVDPTKVFAGGGLGWRLRSVPSRRGSLGRRVGGHRRMRAHCQSLAGPPIDDAVGKLVADTMTPAAVALALEIRKEIEGRYDEADQLRRRVVERAQVEADLAQRRFMMVDPGNRLVADTLEADWNEKLRTLANARDERERGRRADLLVVDEAIRTRLVAMTTDFQKIWSDASTPNRERKRMLAYVIEDATLAKDPQKGTTKIHVRFRGGQTATLTTENPKASWQKVKTPVEIVGLVDRLLDDHVDAEIADILNARGFRPGGSARRGRHHASFTAKRVQYVAHTYNLRPRVERLRARGLLTKKELAARLGIHVSTLTSWVKHGIIKAHACNGHAWLYEAPPARPAKHCSRWDRLTDRAAVVGGAHVPAQDPRLGSKEV